MEDARHRPPLRVATVEALELDLEVAKVFHERAISASSFVENVASFRHWKLYVECLFAKFSLHVFMSSFSSDT